MTQKVRQFCGQWICGGGASSKKIVASTNFGPVNKILGILAKIDSQLPGEVNFAYQI